MRYILATIGRMAYHSATHRPNVPLQVTRYDRGTVTTYTI